MGERLKGKQGRLRPGGRRRSRGGLQGESWTRNGKACRRQQPRRTAQRKGDTTWAVARRPGPINTERPGTVVSPRDAGKAEPTARVSSDLGYVGANHCMGHTIVGFPALFGLFEIFAVRTAERDEEKELLIRGRG